VLEHADVFDAGALLRVLEAPATAPSAALALALQRLQPGEPAWSAAVSLAAYYVSLSTGDAGAVANWLSAEAALSEQLGAVAERARVLRASLSLCEQADSEVCAAACRAAAAAATATALQPAVMATGRLAVLVLVPVVPPLRVVDCRATASSVPVPPCNDGGATGDCSGGTWSEPELELEPRVDGDVDAGSSSARSDGSNASDPRLSPLDDVSCCDAEPEPEAAADAAHGPGTLPGLVAASALSLVVPVPLRAPAAEPERRGLPGLALSSLRRVVAWAGARPWARLWQADPRPGLELRVPPTAPSTKDSETPRDVIMMVPSQ
jgi:hypothetical protein